MLVHLIGVLESHSGELRHANDSKHEDKQHKQNSKGGHRWCRGKESREDLLQLLLLLDQTEDTSDSERA